MLPSHHKYMIKSLVIFVNVIVKRYSKLLFWNVFSSILLALVGSVSIVSLAPIIDLLFEKELESSSIITQRFTEFLQACHIPANLISFFLVFFAITVLKNGFLVFSRYVILKVQFAVMRKLIHETYTIFFTASWRFFSSSNQGVLLNTFSTEINKVGRTFSAMGSLISNCICVLFYLSIPFVVCWQATLICLISVVAFSFPLRYIARISYRLGNESTQTRNRYTSILQETFSAAKLILGFGNQAVHITEVNREFYQYRTAMVRSQILGSILHSIYDPIFAGILLVVLYLSVNKYLIPFSEILVMYYAFLRIMPLFNTINKLAHTIINYLPGYEQVTRLQALAKQHYQTTGTRSFNTLEEAIVVRDLHFAYADHPPVLQNIHLTIPKGQMVAFVGASGAGKTTLLDLLMGFYEPMQGSITIDGRPLQEYDIISFRQRIGFVPQDTILFNMSIRENLLWSCEEATRAELDNACHLANAYDFIQELPQKYDTVVGDRGVRLSVGQRQRIALARAILRKPEILFLDEATSALDSESERLIQQSIENIAKATTVVVVAHRLSTIKRADHIYVLANGTIAEHGTFDELIRQGRLFKRMVELQQL